MNPQAIVELSVAGGFTLTTAVLAYHYWRSIPEIVYASAIFVVAFCGFAISTIFGI